MDIAEIITTATADQITEARDWASDCMGLVDRTVSAERAVAYIAQYYPGGWNAFVEEVCVPAIAEDGPQVGQTVRRVDFESDGTPAYTGVIKRIERDGDDVTYWITWTGAGATAPDPHGRYAFTAI